MKANINRSIGTIKNEVSECLEGKSIYEMTVWVRDHAQYLKWFCNYDEFEIGARIQPFMNLSFFLHENFKNDLDAIKHFKTICEDCVLDLEINCR